MKIINLLLDSNKLIFQRDDLLENEPLRRTSAEKFQDNYLNKEFDMPIWIFRILDSRRENFKLKKLYQSKIAQINMIVTAPEIEMLIIINEGLFDEYQKVKSKQKPSIFCKGLKKFKGKDLKSEDFIADYFSNINDLIFAIKEYKRLCVVKSTEFCLADILSSHNNFLSHGNA